MKTSIFEHSGCERGVFSSAFAGLRATHKGTSNSAGPFARRFRRSLRSPPHVYGNHRTRGKQFEFWKYCEGSLDSQDISIEPFPRPRSQSRSSDCQSCLYWNLQAQEKPRLKMRNVHVSQDSTLRRHAPSPFSPGRRKDSGECIDPELGHFGSLPPQKGHPLLRMAFGICAFP